MVHHFVGTDIERLHNLGTHQPNRPLDAFCYEQERAALLTISENLDATAARERDFAA